jgi:osmotically-inducible protein OsmY
MTPRTWSYGEVEGFGQQGFAMRDHVPVADDFHRGAERVDLGERVTAQSGPKNWQRSDERVHDDVCRMLADDEWVDASDVEVVVHHREVTLAGSVPDPRQRARAVAIAEAARGVVEVVSRLRVAQRR